MTKEIATLGYFLKIATMAWIVSTVTRSQLLDILTVNVLRLVNVELTNSELTVGSLSSAITAWEVVDDKSSDLVATNVLNCILDGGDLSPGIAGMVSYAILFSSSILTSRGRFRRWPP